jgi:5'-nucleotidase
VRVAVLHGRPGVALSQYRKRGLSVDWHRAVAWVTTLLQQLLAQEKPIGAFWNVNLPHLSAEAADPQPVYCPLDPAPLPVSYRLEGELLHYDGDYHERVRQTGSDVDVCFRGGIAVTRITLG